MESAPARSLSPDGTPASKQAKLTPEQVEWVDQALMTLRNGVFQARLYPLDSHQYQRLCDVAGSAWAALLASIRSVTVELAAGRVFINGERARVSKTTADAIQTLEKSLRDIHATGLTAQQGLEQAEVGLFMHALGTEEFGAGKDAQDVNVWLRQNRVEHLTLVGAGGPRSAVWSSTTDGIEARTFLQLSGRLSYGLARISDPQARGQLRARLAEDLVSKDPIWINEIVSAALTRPSDVPQGSARWCSDPRSDSRSLQLLGAICQSWGSKDTTPELQSALCVLVEHVLAPYAERPEAWAQILPSLPPLLLALAPAWVKRVLRAEATRDPAAQAADLALLPPASLLDEDRSRSVFSVLDALYAQEAAEPFRKLAERFETAAQTPRTATRALAVRKLLLLGERYAAGPLALDGRVETFLTELARHETEADVFRLVVQHLAARVPAHFAAGRMAAARTSFERLQFFSTVPPPALPQGVQLASEACDGLLTSGLPSRLLLAILQTPAEAASILALLRDIGPRAYPQLVRTIRECPDDAHQRLLVEALQQLGSAAVEALLAEMGRAPAAATALRLFSACQGLAQEDGFWVQLPLLLMHGEMTVRQQALEFCARSADPRAIVTLAGVARRERDRARLLHLLEALDQRRDPSCIALLGELIERQIGATPDQELLIQILRNLAAFPDPAIIPPIAALLQPAPGTMLQGLLRRTTGRVAANLPPKAVCVMALEALGGVYQHPDAVALLMSLRTSPDPDIARTAIAVSRGLGRLSRSIRSVSEGTRAFAAEQPAPPVRTTGVIPAAPPAERPAPPPPLPLPPLPPLPPARKTGVIPAAPPAERPPPLPPSAPPAPSTLPPLPPLPPVPRTGAVSAAPPAEEPAPVSIRRSHPRPFDPFPADNPAAPRRPAEDGPAPPPAAPQK